MIVWVGEMGKNDDPLKWVHAIDYPFAAYGARAVCGRWIRRKNMIADPPPIPCCKRCLETLDTHNKRMF